jgi:alkanesulfonate monooxygenase SsuD/methylene tetrahydromethanopterin reductase-like flavin-dependent oxidoreductase (luciferase family)
MLATVANSDTGVPEPRRVVEAARRAEAAGFDGVYVGDHLLHPHPLLESIVSLSAVAACTERVSLGPCVMLVGLRDPLLLAKQLGTLSAFAPGRLRVGVGVGGEYPGEFDVAGVPLSARGRRMEDSLRQLQQLLREGVDHEPLTIAPVGAVPFLVAGWKEVSLRRAARYGDGWIGYLLRPESFARRRSLLAECRADLGRADEPFSTGMLLPVHIDRSGRGRARAAAAWAGLTDAALPEELFLAGTADEVVAQVHRYWELGCTEVILGPADQGTGYLAQVDLLSAEVLPQLRSFR